MTTSPRDEPWVLATRNRGKLRELRALFADAGIAVIDLLEAGLPEHPDEAHIECYDSFEENALAKARYFRLRTGGRVVVADDSGLEICALGNAPGVRSRRWSGRTDLAGRALDDANNAKLRRELSGVPNRRARFVCAAAWSGVGRDVVAIGEVEGTIVDDAAGTEGFGYDPYFLARELGMTLAQASVETKQAVSHRARAFTALLRRLHDDGLVERALG